MDFQQLWQLKDDWFEAPNRQRGGWSGVIKSTIEFKGQQTPVFIKRQENYTTHSLRFLLFNQPTYKKEFLNIKLLQKLDIPTLEPLFFDTEGKKAILVTRSLEGYTPLSSEVLKPLSAPERYELMRAIAKVSARLHQHKLQHNCFYPKHIYLKRERSWVVRLIDLEKMRTVMTRNMARKRDFNALFRQKYAIWNVRLITAFIKAYYGEQRLSSHAKETIRAIIHQL